MSTRGSLEKESTGILNVCLLSTFRFFFKTLCEDLDNTVIQEEITNDSDILPLYEGKVMALVKPSE